MMRKAWLDGGNEMIHNVEEKYRIWENGGDLWFCVIVDHFPVLIGIG
jgi:hypothetical protein